MEARNRGGGGGAEHRHIPAHSRRCRYAGSESSNIDAPSGRKDMISVDPRGFQVALTGLLGKYRACEWHALKAVGGGVGTLPRLPWPCPSQTRRQRHSAQTISVVAVDGKHMFLALMWQLDAGTWNLALSVVQVSSRKVALVSGTEMLVEILALSMWRWRVGGSQAMRRARASVHILDVIFSLAHQSFDGRYVSSQEDEHAPSTFANMRPRVLGWRPPYICSHRTSTFQGGGVSR